MPKMIAVLLILAGCVGVAGAQTSASSSVPGWARVQALAPGATLNVKLQTGTRKCNFQAATEDSLSCAQAAGKVEVLQRASILRIQMRHRGRSTLAGAAIGAGVGAAVGAPLGQSGSFVGHGAAAVIFAVPGALFGAIIGAATDFTHATLYRAP